MPKCIENQQAILVCTHKSCNKPNPFICSLSQNHKCQEDHKYCPTLHWVLFKEKLQQALTNHNSQRNQLIKLTEQTILRSIQTFYIWRSKFDISSKIQYLLQSLKLNKQNIWTGRLLDALSDQLDIKNGVGVKKSDTKMIEDLKLIQTNADDLKQKIQKLLENSSGRGFLSKQFDLPQIPQLSFTSNIYNKNPGTPNTNKQFSNQGIQREKTLSVQAQGQKIQSQRKQFQFQKIKNQHNDQFRHNTERQTPKMATILADKKELLLQLPKKTDLLQRNSSSRNKRPFKNEQYTSNSKLPEINGHKTIKNQKDIQTIGNRSSQQKGSKLWLDNQKIQRPVKRISDRSSQQIEKNRLTKTNNNLNLSQLQIISQRNQKPLENILKSGRTTSRSQRDFKKRSDKKQENITEKSSPIVKKSEKIERKSQMLNMLNDDLRKNNINKNILSDQKRKSTLKISKQIIKPQQEKKDDSDIKLSLQELILKNLVEKQKQILLSYQNINKKASELQEQKQKQKDLKEIKSEQEEVIKMKQIAILERFKQQIIKTDWKDNKFIIEIWQMQHLYRCNTLQLTREVNLYINPQMVSILVIKMFQIILFRGYTHIQHRVQIYFKSECIYVFHHSTRKSYPSFNLVAKILKNPKFKNLKNITIYYPWPLQADNYQQMLSSSLMNLPKLKQCIIISNGIESTMAFVNLGRKFQWVNQKGWRNNEEWDD